MRKIASVSLINSVTSPDHPWLSEPAIPIVQNTSTGNAATVGGPQVGTSFAIFPGMKSTSKKPKIKEVKKPPKAYTRLTTLRGLVIPVAWDEKGNVMATVISTQNEEEYVVERSGKGEELFKLIRAEVEVRGVIKAEDNKRIILA